MSFEERMFFEAILEQLKQVDRRLTDIESRLTPNPNWVDACPACEQKIIKICGCQGTLGLAPTPANPDTRDGEYSSHLMAGPFKSSCKALQAGYPTGCNSVPCDCGDVGQDGA